METSTNPPILIAGTGAMACLFAARLAAAGYPVTMLGSWPEGLAALRNDGVRLIERSPDDPAQERERLFPVQVLDSSSLKTLANCPGFQYALVLVKSWQTRRTGCHLLACLAKEGLALTLQNGLGNREALADILGTERVALGVATVGANLAAPGVVRAGGEGVLTLGDHPRLAPLTRILRTAGFNIVETGDPDAVLWGKLAINAAINPLTALLGVPNGELLKRPTARQALSELARETALVAAAQGIHLPYPDPVQAAEEVAERTAANRSSMLQDVQRGAPTEIDAICGNILEAGEQFGVETPLNRAMWLLVKAMVEGNGQPSKPNTS